jgi:hypothetical protein
MQDSGTISDAKIAQYVKANIDVSQYREIRAQIINNAQQEPDHVLLHLLSKEYHRVDFASARLDNRAQFKALELGYRLNSDDLAQQPGLNVADATCPDETVEMIAFCPNDIQLELDVTKEVATAAKAKGLKTVELYKEKATREAYLNYMSCPNLKGNFYDGDSNPELFITNDGVISASDISTLLKGKWKHKVTNVWLACQAYNAPMLPAVVDDAQARKYGAGINDLQVGPSDRAGACTMKAAFEGKPLTQSFNDCYKEFDVPSDHWGFGGNGTDYFFDQN